MSRAARDSSDNFSLFPFLAVLLCLMGALLVLLMGLTKAGNDRVSKQEAVRQASAAKNDPPPKTASQLVEIQQYTAQLETVRSTATARMREDQARLSHLEDHMRRLKDELGTLQIAAMELEAMASEHTDDRAQAQSELARINRLSDELQERIDQLQEEQRGKGKSYAIVPYEGRNGTHRPTIYVECREDRVILQPEGVELQPADFQAPLGAGNPLAAAMRAAREYILAANSTGANGDDVEPYPLILVRPNGVGAYYKVRAALRGWEADFGYELVDGDWNLTYPAPNPELTRREQRAIDEARARRQLLAEAAPKAYGTAGGSFDIEEEDTNGSGEGYASGGPNEGSGTGFGSNDQPGIGDGAGSDGITPSNADIGVHGGVSPGGQTGLAEMVATESSPAGAFSGPALVHGGASGGDSTAGRLGGGNGPAATPSDELDGTASGSADAPSEAGQGSDAKLAAQRGGPGGSPQQAGESPTQGGGSTSENSQAGAAGGAQGSQMGMQSAAADGSPVASQSASSGPGGDTSGASASLDITPKAARNRGKDWAIRDATPSNVAIRRTVQVVVRAEQIAILPDRVQTGPVVQDPVGKMLSVNAARTIPVETFVSGLWEHMEQWGIAGNGLYWKPILVLNVAPGGERRAAELTQLLRNSGVEVRASDTAQRTDQPSHATPR
ncbi:MAG: hypothetical protein WD851_16880 [Pirellulales bacterium]